MTEADGNYFILAELSHVTFEHRPDPKGNADITFAPLGAAHTLLAI
ncbi:hypothetical protein WG908_10140 [Sphingobium sp. AN641]